MSDLNRGSTPCEMKCRRAFKETSCVIVFHIPARADVVVGLPGKDTRAPPLIRCQQAFKNSPQGEQFLVRTHICSIEWQELLVSF